MMPSDGKMIRGYMEKFERLVPITGFDPVAQAPAGIQSLLAPAAAGLLSDLAERDHHQPPACVIVRSEARGGRRFLGIRQNDSDIDGISRNRDGRHAIIFDDLIASLTACIAAAAADGCPVGLVNMVRLHGESDRSLTREAYAALFLSLIDDVERHLVRLDVAVHWTVVQASGTGATGGGNGWPNRLAVHDVAALRNNVDVAVAGYAYPQYDASHYSARGKLLLGENVGRAIARRLRGAAPALPRPVVLRLDPSPRGAVATLTMAADDPLVLDVTTLPPSDVTLMGFWIQDRTGAVLGDVTVLDATRLALHFDRMPDAASLTIQYAYRNQPRSHPSADVGYPMGRGNLRTTRATLSSLLADTHLHDWVPGFARRAADLMAGYVTNDGVA
ncbi:hypothetical protein SAMN04488003_11913 [Loktanella fryxellensis]|uniref:Sialate O-acetylesterase domain-containing protein n=1 Tax=Loktanella fryxellensis TaxID=245187 RepID=A0A1H8H2H1_9RHOB|nr:hypothetical protein [Loktanella fryxellensis]SEN50446.1 hypothetical protein SAMN04488003_11913 [Loktanella fryxellensis]